MPSLIPDVETLERRFEGLPVGKPRAREFVLTAGSKTGALVFLRSGAVEVVKDGVQIASVNAPGSVFGEQAVLLDQPHTADVRTLEQSEFYVADAPAILARDPTVALYVAAILARRLDAANRWLVAVKRQLQAGAPHSVTARGVGRGGNLLGSGGGIPMGGCSAPSRSGPRRCSIHAPRKDRGGHHEDRTPTHGYEPTREAAIAAF